MSNNPNTTNPLNTNPKNVPMTNSDMVRWGRETDHASRLEKRGKVWTADPYVWKMNADALRGEEE